MNGAAPFRDNAELLALLARLGNLLIEQALQATPPGNEDDAPGADPVARLQRLAAGGASSPESEIPRLWQQQEARSAASISAGTFLPWVHVVSLFQPTRDEQTLLLLALLPELDPRYLPLLQQLGADAQGEGGDDEAAAPGRDARLVPYAAAQRVLAGGAGGNRRFALVQTLGSHACLRQWQLLKLSADGDPALLRGGFRLPPAIAAYLLGLAAPQPRLEEPLPSLDAASGQLADLPLTADVLGQVQRFLAAAEQGSAQTCYLLQLQGPDTDLLETLAATLYAALQLRCLRLDGRALQQFASRGQAALRTRLRAIGRDALLCNYTLVITNSQWLTGSNPAGGTAGNGNPGAASPSDDDQLLHDVLYQLLESQRHVAVINGPAGRLTDHALRYPANPVLPAVIRVPAPNTAMREQVWQRAAAAQGVQLTAETGAQLAEQYPFTAAQIELALKDALSRQLLAPPPAELAPLLFDACREQSRRQTLAVAQEVKTRYRFADIVLPPATRQALQELLNFARHRHRVTEDWQFNQKLDRPTNLVVLFHGPSGTGKTMAASIIANELNLGIYKIDLASVMSKYIGETEKHLAQLFDQAEAMNIVLFFDEAESLFAPRTETRDAHDRYANLQTGYLLQRIESYPGIVILSTNLLKNIDKAFTRRFRFVVEYPFPGTDERRRLWQGAFPAAAPQAGDLDFALLAEKAPLSGGSINNIALSAAVYASADGTPIAMQHVLHATEREYAKLGKVFAPGQFAWTDED